MACLVPKRHLAIPVALWVTRAAVAGSVSALLTRRRNIPKFSEKDLLSAEKNARHVVGPVPSWPELRRRVGLACATSLASYENSIRESSAKLRAMVEIHSKAGLYGEDKNLIHVNDVWREVYGSQVWVGASVDVLSQSCTKKRYILVAARGLKSTLDLWTSVSAWRKNWWEDGVVREDVDPVGGAVAGATMRAHAFGRMDELTAAVMASSVDVQRRQCLSEDPSETSVMSRIAAWKQAWREWSGAEGPVSMLKKVVGGDWPSVREDEEEAPQPTVVLCGHSLGGSVATVLAARLALRVGLPQDCPAEAMQCITFGMPIPWLSPTFRSYQGRVSWEYPHGLDSLQSLFLNVIAEGDPVPTLTCTGWASLGKVVGATVSGLAGHQGEKPRPPWADAWDVGGGGATVVPFGPSLQISRIHTHQPKLAFHCDVGSYSRFIGAPASIWGGVGALQLVGKAVQRRGATHGMSKYEKLLRKCLVHPPQGLEQIDQSSIRIE